MIKKTITFSLIIIFILSCGKNYEKSTYSAIVSKNNTIVFEEYYNGKTQDSLANIQSLTKGLMSILIGIAIDEKYILNENEKIENYFPEEFKELSDKRKSAITIKHLLNQTSGLSWKGYLEHKNWMVSENSIQYVLTKPLEEVPGDVYNYNSGATHLLSVILTKATGKSTLEFANAYLFKPLNIKTVKWEKRAQGYYDGAGFGLKMKPKDLLKIGQLVLNKGVFNSKQIVSLDWMGSMLDEKEKRATKWGISKSKHGYCWYKAELNGEQVDYGMGYGGQFIILIPNKELIIIATHNHDTPNGIDQQIEFLKGKLPKLIEKYGSK